MNTPKTIHNVESIFHATLTKRELFAAMAMMGCLANPVLDGSVKTVAKDAINAADALIAQLGGEG